VNINQHGGKKGRREEGGMEERGRRKQKVGMKNFEKKEITEQGK
jgi:hypothetical protein